MDLKVFVAKTPVSLSAQIQRDVTNGDFTGATLVDEQGQKHYYTAGFHIDDLEDIGLTDETQLAQIRAMDDAGSIDLVTFESDPVHIGFLVTDDLHTVILNGADDIQRLSTVPWTIYEIQHPSSETPFKGSLKPVRDQQGEIVRVDFTEINEYFKQAVETGRLTPEEVHLHKEDLPLVEKPSQSKQREYTDEELHNLVGGDEHLSGKDMSMNIEEKQSEEDRLMEQGEKYYQEQLKKEQEEKRRIEEARKREAQARKQKNKQGRRGSTIPNFKPFQEIVKSLEVQPESEIQRRYLSDLNSLRSYTDSMNISSNIFNPLDEQGRRELMMAMNREREKFVSQALLQLKREAVDVEEKVNVENDESANVGVLEQYKEMFLHPLEELDNDIPKRIDKYEEEREQLYKDGYEDWLVRIEEDPESVYKEMYYKPMVEDAVKQKETELKELFNRTYNERRAEFNQYVDNFVEGRRQRDLEHLELDWQESARMASQTLSERVDGVQRSMENRKMMHEMRRMYEQMEKQAKAQQHPLPIDVEPSHSMQQEGTIQQDKPNAHVQSPSVPEPVVEEPENQAPVSESPEEVKEAFGEQSAQEPENVKTDQNEQPSSPQPIVNRPQDIYSDATPNDDGDWEDDLDDWDDDDLTGSLPDEMTDDDWDDDFDDLDDLDMDDDEVTKKTGKKGLLGLFGKR